MTLQSSGSMTFQDIVTELGTSFPITIPNDVRDLAGKGSGSITIPTDLYGKSLVEETANVTTADTSHSGVSFGADTSGRWVVVLATHGNSASNPGTTPTATIGGVAATRIGAASTGTGGGTSVGMAMFVAQTTGATGTVAVSWSGLDTSIIVLRVVGFTLSSAHDSATSSSTGMPMSVNIPSKGLLIGGVARGSADAITLTNLTERGSDSTDSNSKRRSRGWNYNMSSETGRSVSVSPWNSTASNGVNAAVVASFAHT